VACNQRRRSRGEMQGRPPLRCDGPALRRTAFLLLLVGLFGVESAPAQDLEMKDLSGTGIDPLRYRDTISRLASDEMEGRRVGTPGGWAAIAFVEARFREAGLLPPPDALAGYLQRYRHDWHGKADAANVIGVLPGRDPELKDEVVVVSAHHDHLGRNRDDGCPKSRRGKRIRYGANDNASGVAALVELAFALAGRDDEIARTIVFLSTDGEECGCTGVKHYVFENPVYPLEKTVYVLNIDQIGEGAWLVQHPAVSHVADGEDCEVDGEVFARRGVRAETLVGDNSNYHRPGDVIEKLNMRKALEAVRRAYELVLQAARRDGGA
jgi:hypothetical protein